MKKIITYFVIWTFLFQHTAYVCAYGIQNGSVLAPLPPTEQESSILMRGIVIPRQFQDTMMARIEEAQKLLEDSNVFKTAEEMMFYMTEGRDYP